MTYAWARQVLDWEKDKGIFQPRSSKELLIGFLGAGHYQDATITEVWTTSKYHDLSLEVAGKGHTSIRVYLRGMDGHGPSYLLQRLEEALPRGLPSIDPTVWVGKRIPITVDNQGGVTIGKQQPRQSPGQPTGITVLHSQASAVQPKKPSSFLWG